MTSIRLVYVLSPAKTIDMNAIRISQCTQPRLLSHAHELIEQLRTLSRTKVKSLFRISDALAKLNFDRYQAFDTSKRATEAVNPNKTLKQAALAFNGPAYQGLEAYTLSELDLGFAQTHLRILCGLYGILRPLDLIQPYRLEMGQTFPNRRGKDLYEFWGGAIVDELVALFRQEEASEDITQQQRVLVNVASQEYFKVLSQSALKAANISVINCVFQDDGKIKAVYAKRARGLLCRYLIQNRVDSLEGIAGFECEGYKYSSTASKDDTFVFTRTAANQKLVVQQTKVNAKLCSPRVKRAPRVARNQLMVEARMKKDEEKPRRRHSTRKKRKITN